MRVCEKCGGLLAYYPETFAGKPCVCITGDSTMDLAGEERLTAEQAQVISEVISDAFSKGRIAGIREAAEMCNKKRCATIKQLKSELVALMNRLEREAERAKR